MENSGLLPKAAQLYAWAVFLGAWAQMGWVDWKEQKIRNHYLFFWLKVILAGYLLIVAQSLLGLLGYGQVYLLRDYYLSLLGHVGLSIAAAYSLWWLRIWPAGDVKLFALLALCYPLMRLPGSFRSGLLFLEVLINIFVPAAAFLFLTAGEYLWRTRFAHYKTHLGDYLGARCNDFRLPELDFSRFRLRLPDVDLSRFRFSIPVPAVGGFGDGARTARARFTARAGALWERVKLELSDTMTVYRERPLQFLIDALSWFAMMAVMSMISYYLNDVITSNVLKTLVCFALMFTWSRICQYVGAGWALAVVFCAGAILLWRYPNFNFPAFAVIFGHITVFSLFIWLGVQLAFKIIAGKTRYVFLPFLMMLPGLIPWRFLFLTVWSWLVAAWTKVGSFGLPPAPALPAVRLPEFTAPALPAVPLPALGGVALPAWVAAADFSGLTVWAVMGLFFGLALVFVKIWDAESFVTVPIAHIDRFMTLGPTLVERIEADADFRDEHFSTFYPDGLTGEQAEVLREWCRAEGLETVPLAPTISFANWIFLGYFLTRLLEGHVLRFLY